MTKLRKVYRWELFETECSLLQLVVNYAFKREELQRKGDAVEAKLRKASIELHALGNTLNVVRQRNHAQRVEKDIKPTCQYKIKYILV